MPIEATRLAEIYAKFARYEADGRSPLYVEICNGVAGDQDLLCRLAALPLEKQQPNLLLAAVKYLYGTVNSWPHFRQLIEAHWQDVLAVIQERHTKTNEPARCATLIPLLALLPQPLALLEVGASAGLCLLPDRYSYDYGGRLVSASAPAISASPVFYCAANTQTPIPAKGLDIVWRAGLDIHPLDCTKIDDTNWLRALVWPGEGERARLLDEALAVARCDPPRIVLGDLRHDLVALAKEAPGHATLVVFHTAVLAYVREAEDRRAFADSIRDLGAQWVSNESVNLFENPELPEEKPFDVTGLWGRFLLSLNGRPVAYTDAHGTAIVWFAPDKLSEIQSPDYTVAPLVD